MNRYIGVEIDGDYMYLMAETSSGQVEHAVPTGRDCTLAPLIREVADFAAKLPYRPSGIGIGMPGLVSGTGKVELSHVLPALNGATAEAFAAEAKVPVVFINDVKAATMAEASHYADRDTVAVVQLDTFIASGVVVKGALLTGAKGWSGELGYMIVALDGKPVLLDTVASGYAILKDARITDDELRERLAAGDEPALALVRQAGTYMGYALTNLLHLYNPDVLVIGGTTTTYRGYLDAARAALEAHALPELLACCTIEQPRIKHRVIAYGAREWAGKQLGASASETSV
ncbi:ROK family protein [Paenibacillus xanthanilyticus]|uniref:ROK family protein n=1 Tax=Paenibacillus xanthanilyticus TaxID=1783531 RepID=A0ABV8JV64_9BACL